MNRIARIIFAALVSCILLAPTVNLAYSLLTGKAPKSELEGRDRPELIPAAWKTTANGKAQAAFDAALGFSTPQRDSALLLHAKWQRKFIRLASLLSGFDIYPTYYGSKFFHDHGREQILPAPRRNTSRQKKSLERLAQRYAAAMRAHQNVRWFFALIDQPYFSATGSFRTLVNNPFTYNVSRMHLLQNLPDFCTVIDLGYSEGEDIYNDYFKTDHHWRIQGAVRAYKKIAHALGIVPITFGQPAPVTSATFFGSFARQGLDVDVPGDAIWDAPYARSALAVKVNGKPVPESYLNYGYSGRPYEKLSKFEDMLTRYFHGQRAETHITNKRIKRGALLIVGDSNTHSMERFFAESYREVYKVDPRHTGEDSLGKFLRRHAVDDVLLLFAQNRTAEITPDFLR